MLEWLADMIDEAFMCIKAVVAWIGVSIVVALTLLFTFLFLHPAGWVILILLAGKWIFT